MQASAFMNDFAMSYIAWYDAFHVHAILLDVNFQRGSHTVAVLGENFPK